jgi:hypothetical protein
MVGSYERHSTSIVPHQGLFLAIASWCNHHVATERR